MAQIVSRKQIRILKLILVSHWLEKALIILFLTCTIVLLILRQTSYSSSQAIKRQHFWVNKAVDTFTSSVHDTDSFVSWLKTDFYNYQCTSHLDFFKPFGNALLIMYKPQLDPKCYDKLNPTQYSNTFSKDCNPLPSSSISLTPLDVVDPALCISSDCGEFEAQNTNKYKFSSNFFTYTQDNTYSVAIAINNNATFYDQHANLEANGWINQTETKALILVTNFIDPNQMLVLTYIFIMESYSPNATYTYFQKAFPSHGIHVDDITLFIVAMYGITGIIFILKSFFEMSIEFKMFIHPASVACGALQLTYTVLTITKMSRRGVDFPNPQPISSYGSSNQYYHMNFYSTITMIQDTVLGILLIFVPFRFFSLISWSRYMGYFNKFASTIYRTFPTIGILIVTLLLLLVSWSYFPFLMLQEHFYKFSDYGLALLNMVFLDLTMSTDDFVPEEHSTIHTLTTNIQIHFSAIYYMRILIIVFCVAFLAEAYRKASDFENHQEKESEKESMAFLDDFTKKIDKFVKENLPQLDRVSLSKSRKILVWLDPNVRKFDPFEDIFMAVEETEIRLMIFTHHLEVIQFLKYLFQLKPNLLHKSADTFRIVVENKEEFEPDDNRLHLLGFDLTHAEVLIDWLRGIGSRVPVMLFSKNKIPYERMLQMKKNYINLYFSSNPAMLKSFSLLESLQAIKMQKLEKQEESELFSNLEVSHNSDDSHPSFDNSQVS